MSYNAPGGDHVPELPTEYTVKIVKVKYNLTLIDMKTSKVISSKTFEHTHDAKTLDANGGVEALTEALREAFKDSMNWINGICQ